jgi:RNA 2',3'-cyclic 3'-phosphodiesterase
MFIALDISADDKVKIAQWREQHLNLPFKAVAEQNFHITLAFLGLLDSAQQVNISKLIRRHHSSIDDQIKSLSAKKSNLSLVLSQLDYFNKAQVLHLKPTSCPDWLCYLHKTIMELSLKCRIDIEHRAYQPHLSLYRKAKLPSPAYLKELNQAVIEKKLHITSFSLYHSYSTPQGLCYQSVQSWQLNF